MTTLLSLPITTAASGTSTVLQLAEPRSGAIGAAIIFHANFAWGSAGTTVDAYMQTSLDGGTNWCDAAHFAFTTAIARSVAAVTSTKSFVPTAPTDGTLAAGTVNDGLFGPLWRVKYVTVGTYAGGTTLRIDAFSPGLTAV